MKAKKDSNDFDTVLKRMLNTPPKPHKKTAKKKEAKKRAQGLDNG